MKPLHLPVCAPAVSFVCILCMACCTTSHSQTIGAVDSIYSQLEATYIDLHRNPELSTYETRTRG
jgi:hypothetical protein